MKCTHVCATQRADQLSTKLLIKPEFPCLVDEIVEPRPDMNINVAAFTVSEKSSNISGYNFQKKIYTCISVLKIYFSHHRVNLVKYHIQTNTLWHELQIKTPRTVCSQNKLCRELYTDNRIQFVVSFDKSYSKFSPHLFP